MKGVILVQTGREGTTIPLYCIIDVLSPRVKSRCVEDLRSKHHEDRFMMF